MTIIARLFAAIDTAIDTVINGVAERIVEAWVDELTPPKVSARHAERPAHSGTSAWDHVGDQKVGPGGAANAILPALAPEDPRRIS